MYIAATLRARIETRRNVRLSILWCVLAAMIVLLAQPQIANAREPGSEPLSASGDLVTSIDQFVSAYVDGRNFSGSILVAQGDAVLMNNGYGMSIYEQAVPNAGSTRYVIGSVSKSFTAAAILLLQERGQLDLDDPVSRFIPDYPRGHEIKIRHLLDHTSGLPRIVFSPDFGERSQRHHTVRQLVEWFQDKPLVDTPGRDYSYSNANYSLLAHIVETVARTSYGEFLRTNILEPLDLFDTGDKGATSTVIESLALGYTPVGHSDLVRSRNFDYSIYTGAGSLYSTTSDLFRWFQARRQGRLDFGWNPEQRLGREALVMRGWDGVGFSAHFIHYQAEDVTVIVMGNLNMSSIASEIAENVSAIVFGEEHDRLEVLPDPPVDRQVLLDMAGLYRFGPDFYVPNTTIRIAESDGQLIVPGSEFAPEGGLLPVSETEFIHRQQWISVRFKYSTDGAIEGIAYGNFEATKEQALP